MVNWVACGVLLGALAAQCGAARGEDAAPADHQEPGVVRMNFDDAVRMSPWFQSAEPIAADDEVIAAEPNNPVFALNMRPREYNFAEWLLNRDADPQVVNDPPEVALSLAIALRDMKLLRRMLDKGIDPNAALLQPIPPGLGKLFDNTFIAYLLAKDSRVTPLMLAVLGNQEDAVRILLQHGANTEIPTRRLRMYPLDFAAQLKKTTLMQLILGREPTLDEQGQYVIVCISAQKAWLMNNGVTMLETPVSTGRPGYDTSPGEYVVTQKYTAWKSTLYKVPMPNFMRLNCGPTGLHGGYVPGTPISHGCIRVPAAMAAVLYTTVKLGDRVTIVE